MCNRQGWQVGRQLSLAAPRRRLIGASGFQLINVNNVPLSLRGWSVDTRLIGRKALTNSLMRHYIAQAISEAHKACFPVPATFRP